MCEDVRLAGVVKVSADIPYEFSVHNIRPFLRVETPYALVGVGGLGACCAAGVG